MRAEVQGALVLGDVGVVIAKPSKVAQYLCLGMELLRRGKSTLKELQIVTGGLVYLGMFRHPLLCSLNQVRVHMEFLKAQPPVLRVELPDQVLGELFRFLCLVPLSQMNFRAKMLGQATCSDASSSGGGFCVSQGLTHYGVCAASSSVRGEPLDLCQVLSVGLFDGLGALRVACDLVGLPMGGHISVECDGEARRVVESHFPDSIFHDDVTSITLDLVRGWAQRFQNVGLILLGGGPPCQGVSGLNAGRRGALRDHRSCLFQEIPRIEQLFRLAFPWAQLQRLVESVASMDDTDLGYMSEAFGEDPWRCDCFGLSLCHRPRVFWVSWELQEGEGVSFLPCSRSGVKGEIVFNSVMSAGPFLLPGWQVPEGGLPTFTTPRLRSPLVHDLQVVNLMRFLAGKTTSTDTHRINTKIGEVCPTRKVSGDSLQQKRKKL